jgi:hypothetical protein
MNITESLNETFWEKNLMIIIEYTSYIAYTIIFIIGITGNSVVIYVLLSSVCFLNKKNGVNNLANVTIQQDTPALQRKNSLKIKKTTNVIFRNESVKENNPIQQQQQQIIDNEIVEVKQTKKIVTYSDSIIENEVINDKNDFVEMSNKKYSLVSSTNDIQRNFWVNFKTFYF